MVLVLSGVARRVAAQARRRTRRPRSPPPPRTPPSRARRRARVRDMADGLLNFAILVGALVYFLKAPSAGYLADASAQIRQDLVDAAEMRATATAQLEEIQQKLQALPAELDSESAGAEEDVAEEQRIAQAAPSSASG